MAESVAGAIFNAVLALKTAAKDVAENKVLCEDLVRRTMDYSTFMNRKKKNIRNDSDPIIIRSLESFKAVLEEAAKACVPFKSKSHRFPKLFKIKKWFAHGDYHTKFDHINKKIDLRWHDLKEAIELQNDSPAELIFLKERELEKEKEEANRRSTIVYERQERADALAAEEEHASFTEEIFGFLQARAQAEAEDEMGEPARSSFTRKASVFGGFQQSRETSNSSDYGFSSGSESDDDEFDGFGFDFDTSNTCNTKTPMVHGVVVKTLMVLVAVKKFRALGRKCALRLLADKERSVGLRRTSSLLSRGFNHGGQDIGVGDTQGSTEAVEADDGSGSKAPRRAFIITKCSNSTFGHFVQGRYEETYEVKNGKSVYVQSEEPSICCWYSKHKTWRISLAVSKDADIDSDIIARCADKDAPSPEAVQEWEMAEEVGVEWKACVMKISVMAAGEGEEIVPVKDWVQPAGLHFFTPAQGRNALFINGVFSRSDATVNDAPVYTKVGNSNVCCWHVLGANRNCWALSSVALMNAAMKKKKEREGGKGEKQHVSIEDILGTDGRTGALMAGLYALTSHVDSNADLLRDWNMWTFDKHMSFKIHSLPGTTLVAKGLDSEKVATFVDKAAASVFADEFTFAGATSEYVSGGVSVAEKINGVYFKAGGQTNGKPVYSKIGKHADVEWCIWYNRKRQWMVSRVDKMKSNAEVQIGVAHSFDIGLNAPQLVKCWKVLVDYVKGSNKYEIQTQAHATTTTTIKHRPEVMHEAIESTAFVFSYHKVRNGQHGEQMMIPSNDPDFVKWHGQNPDICTEKGRLAELDKRLLIFVSIGSLMPVAGDVDFRKGCGATSLTDKDGDSWVEQVMWIDEQTIAYGGIDAKGGLPILEIELPKLTLLKPKPIAKFPKKPKLLKVSGSGACSKTTRAENAAAKAGESPRTSLEPRPRSNTVGSQISLPAASKPKLTPTPLDLSTSPGKKKKRLPPAISPKPASAKSAVANNETQFPFPSELSSDGGGGAVAPAGAGKPCGTYQVDLVGKDFGDCKCGFPKAKHSKFRPVSSAW